MKVTRLTFDGASANCHLIEAGDFRILVDCGLNLSLLSHYPASPDSFSAYPEPLTGDGISRPLLVQTPLLTQIDTSQLDAIVITHPRQMLGLPYLSELSDFSGQILATEPTLQFGRQLMEEFVQLFGPDAHCTTDNFVANPDYDETLDTILPLGLKNLATDDENSQFGANPWRRIYNKYEAKACIAKIRPVQYNERTLIHDKLCLEPYCSGYSLGSANWLISFGDTKLGYVSASTLGIQLHPLPMDMQLLKLATHLLLTDTSSEAPSPVANLSRIGTEVVRILRQGGNVLFPCHIQGVVFDLIATIGEHMEAQSIPAQILVVSPSAEAALHYANIAGEWMNSNLQQMVYLPEMPLGHGKLMANGRLKYFSGVHSSKFREEFWDHDRKRPKPCVVFASHPSLRAGPALHFARIFKDDPKSAIIFTDPFYDCPKSTSGGVQVQDLALELRLNPKLVFQTIQDHQPKSAILPRFLSLELAPKAFTATKFITEICSSEIVLTASTHELCYAKITPEIARGILPKRLGHLQIAPVTGTLHLKDSQYTIDICPGAAQSEYLGTDFVLPVTPTCLLKLLLMAGFVDVDVIKLPLATKILIPSLDASILFESGKIQIATQSFLTRLKLTEYLQTIRSPGFGVFSLSPDPQPEPQKKQIVDNRDKPKSYPRSSSKSYKPNSLPHDTRTNQNDRSQHRRPYNAHRNFSNDSPHPQGNFNQRPPFRRPNQSTYQSNYRTHRPAER